MNKEEFIKECNRKAIEAIMEFIGKFNILVDEKLIEDQINIPVTIGRIKTEIIEHATAEYDDETDSITVNIEEFEREKLTNYNNKNVQFYFIKAIVHERLHSLRRQKVEKSERKESYHVGMKDDSLISNDYALEESLTEAFAIMITSNYLKNSNLSLGKLREEVEKYENNIGEGIAAIIIEKMQEEGLEWFLTTRYQENYRNILEEIFNEDYQVLCDELTRIYYTESNSPAKKEQLIGMINKHFRNNSQNKSFS